MSDFSNPIFHDETKARKWLEARVWPNGPVCPKCGVVGEARLMQGKSHRPGLVPVQRLPPAIHRDRWHVVRAQQNPSPQMAGRYSPDDGVQERDECA